MYSSIQLSMIASAASLFFTSVTEVLLSFLQCFVNLKNALSHQNDDSEADQYFYNSCSLDH